MPVTIKDSRDTVKDSSNKRDSASFSCGGYILVGMSQKANPNRLGRILESDKRKIQQEIRIGNLGGRL